MVNIDNLFKMISEKGITQSKLAENTSISTGNISDWKKGKSMPSAIKLDELATYFNCSVDYLLGRTDSPNGYNNNQIHNSDNVALGENAQVNVNATVKSYDEMTAELIKRFQSLSFDEKIEVFNYIKNIK